LNILLAFAPFIIFALIDRSVGPTEGLVTGAMASAALLLRDWLMPGRSPKILEIGTVILFGALALYAVFGGPTWSIVGVRLYVDAGLLFIVLISVALRLPFTLQYAREKVPMEFWNSRQFVRTNYVITGVWAVAFAVLVLADLILLYIPTLPPRIGIFMTIGALVGAVKFTLVSRAGQRCASVLMCLCGRNETWQTWLERPSFSYYPTMRSPSF
jgi:hypothetical protein